MPHRPTPPSAARTRRDRPLWAPLLLAVVVAAVALTAALSGGTLPGLADAASTTEVDPRADGTPPATGSADPATTSATAPATSSSAAAPVETTTAVPSPVSTPAPSPEPDPAPAPPSVVTPSPRAPAPSVAPAPAPAPPPAAAAAPAAPGPEGQVLTLVNTERAAAGCAPVSADAGLAAVARAHSADMRDRDFFDHVNPDGVDPFARAEAAGVGYARAENIAAGQPDAAAVMADWMASPGHRKNILNCDLRTLGVGVATGPGGPWWTQLFGS
ncbi:CAP domain-containing protein [Modestobacter italicus]|uniref:CAP domain-containing protein n=1 Tax=Modestobacter italicus (strain DSM 44449 / CECT 9708 / BC 501) TaxID=2732864 RepID=UPI0027DFF6E5|nr:CAP domain-containing protein [Modestobacter italicus]